MISDFVYDLCHERETVTSRLAADPTQAPGEIAKQLFGKKNSLPNSDSETKPEYNLDRAAQCGNWGGSRPSDLFLKVCHILRALCSVECGLHTSGL